MMLNKNVVPILIALATVVTITLVDVIPINAQLSAVWVDDGYCDGCAYDTMDIQDNDDTETPAFKLKNPNGGETIPSGSTYTINWVAPAQAATFSLVFSTNKGKKWKQIEST